MKSLLPELPVPLQVTRQQVLYFRPDDETPFRVGRFPVFIYKGHGPDDDFYGMPPYQGLGVKVARHSGPEVDPDVEDRTVGEAYRRVVRAFLQDHMPALARAPIDLTETCLYTVAPDEHFVVDFLPGRSDVIVASPCSGHGFKFSCLIGKVLADLATSGRSSHRAPRVEAARPLVMAHPSGAAPWTRHSTESSTAWLLCSHSIGSGGDDLLPCTGREAW